eukprot:scaffold116408_cov24-Attheya_sp.AAC.2
MIELMDDTTMLRWGRGQYFLCECEARVSFHYWSFFLASAVRQECLSLDARDSKRPSYIYVAVGNVGFFPVVGVGVGGYKARKRTFERDVAYLSSQHGRPS